MSSGVLSQEEIDALLKGDGTPTSTTTPSAEVKMAEGSLSDMEIDAVGEIANISMGSAATALSQLLGRKVDITTPRVIITNLEEIQKEYPTPYVLVNVQYTAGIEGSNVLIVKDSDASIIVDLMMGGDGSVPPSELNEIHISAVSEAMNQMMGSAATSMSTILKQRIDISPPLLNIQNIDSNNFEESLGSPVIKVAFKMQIEDLIDSEIMQLMPINFARDLVSDLMNGIENENAIHQEQSQVVSAPPQVNVAETTSSQQAPPVEQASPLDQIPPMAAASNMSIPGMDPMAGYPPNYYPPMAPPYGMPNYGGGYPQGNYPPAGYQIPPQAQPMSSVTVQPAQFAPLNKSMDHKEISNIDLIMDVPLQITVELGRARKTIKDILALTTGAVLELDKLAGEPVDVLVNGKLLAKGEVVVIDENFGIRITDIVSPMERVNNLQ